jgi:hypothetical protein
MAVHISGYVSTYPLLHITSLGGHSEIANALDMRAMNYVLKHPHRLRVFENRVLRRIFGPKRAK